MIYCPAYHKIIALLLLGVLFASPAGAFEREEVLQDAALEAEARALFKEIRCVVCESQSLADSDADLAYDMRLLIRSQLKAGKDAEEVKRYLLERYGEVILMSPPKDGATLVLWWFPYIILIFSAFLVFWRVKKTKNT